MEIAARQGGFPALPGADQCSGRIFFQPSSDQNFKFSFDHT